MKKIILSSLFCFSLLSLLAQDTWAVEIPCENGNCYPFDLIKTSDGNLLLLVRKSIEEDGFQKLKHYLIKYNLDGEVLWEKEHDFGLSEPYSTAGNWGGVREPNTIIQTPNKGFISSGKYYESDTIYCYNFITNEQGDSLFFQKFVSGSVDCISPRYVFISQIYAMRYNQNTGYYSVAEISENLDIVYEVALENSNEYLARSIIDQDLNVYTEKFGGETWVRKYSISGDLQLEETHEEQCSLLAINTEGYLTCYYEGLLQLNSDLSKRWYLPFEDILPSWPPHYISPKVINATSDGGFILGGDASVDPFELVFLAKINENGTKDWGFVYDPFYLSAINTLSDVIETVGGYILLGRNSFTGNTWLIKVDENGLLSDTNTPAATTSASMVSLFPNPASSFINLQFTRPFSGNIQVMDMSGRLLQQQSVDLTNTVILNIGDLPDGMYWVRLNDQATGAYETLKFVKSLYRK